MVGVGVCGVRLECQRAFAELALCLERTVEALGVVRGAVGGWSGRPRRVGLRRSEFDGNMKYLQGFLGELLECSRGSAAVLLGLGPGPGPGSPSGVGGGGR